VPGGVLQRSNIHIATCPRRGRCHASGPARQPQDHCLQG
jgi:hypothetical protein